MRQSSQSDTQSLNQMRMGVLGAVTAMFVCFGLSFAFTGEISSAEAQQTQADG